MNKSDHVLFPNEYHGYLNIRFSTGTRESRMTSSRIAAIKVAPTSGNAMDKRTAMMAAFFQSGKFSGIGGGPNLKTFDGRLIHHIAIPLMQIVKIMMQKAKLRTTFQRPICPS